MNKKSVIMLGAAALLGLSGVASPAFAQPAQAAEVTTRGTDQQAFINKIAGHAVNSAEQYGIYPSVMMAQAILESGWGSSQLAQAPNYNLFGIKGTYNGNSVWMPTKEWDANLGQYVSINAQFRKYPSFFESFGDNGNKLRNGISGSPAFYSGTWLENTSSYRDSTQWLQGRYATSPTYASKLNNIIETYGLDQYDTKVTKLSDVATIHYTPGYGIALFNTFSGVRTNPTNTYLPDGSSWQVHEKAVKYDGTVWYNVGWNQWIMGEFANLGANNAGNNNSGDNTSGVGTVHYVPGYGIAVWNQPTEGAQMTGQYLPDGSAWKLLSKNVVNGHTWYEVGYNQWVDSTYVW